MENENYENAKKKAREIYNKILRVESPKLDEPITFNKIGFRHLIRKGGKRRTKADQIRRFALLVHAKEIIKDPETEITSTEREIEHPAFRHGSKIRVKTQTRFWSFRKITNNKSITVVVRQLGRGTKHFFSIYDKKQRNQKAVG